MNQNFGMMAKKLDTSCAEGRGDHPREHRLRALLTKAAFVVLAVLGYATLWIAVAPDMGASLLVVANG